MARKAAKLSKQETQQVQDCTAAYIRVSTDKQAEEGYSLEAQLAKVRAYCQAQGWRLCDEHVYTDAGVSGKSTARPQFQAMLDAAQAKLINRVVTVKLDRIARNTRDFLSVVDQLTKLGCELAIIKENFDTSSPHGKFALTMFAAMAELEVSMIQERTMSGRTQKATQAGFNGAPIPYGYDYNGERFTLNDKSQVVAGIFADYLNGVSMEKLAAKLNAEGVPTARGGKWYASTVAYVLHNGFYAGLVQYDGSEVTGNHPAIITVADYERAQK